MLSKAQEKFIKSLHRKKGRKQTGHCLVEGEKVIKTAGNAIDLVFTHEDSAQFDSLVTTQAPQDMAATAKIPQWNESDIEAKNIIVVADGVQDPGNIGAILRLCLGFDASLLLVESADPTNPKVVRSSAGAMFHVPWVEVNRSNAKNVIEQLERPVYRMENTTEAKELRDCSIEDQIVLLVGSEGRGVRLKAAGISIKIEHSKQLESLNVANALAIVLYQLKKPRS